MGCSVGGALVVGTGQESQASRAWALEGWMQACARGFEADTPLGPSPAMRRMQVELSGAVQCSEVQRTRLFRVGSAGAGRRCSSTRGLRGLAVEEARSESRDGGDGLWEPKECLAGRWSQ